MAPRRALIALAALAALVAGGAACGSGSGHADVATGATPTTEAPAATTTRAAPTTAATTRLPTVPNCGGGAYEPRTLLIVCGSGATMATDVAWRSWQPAAASATGTVHLQVNGRTVAAPAVLMLSEVVNGPVGPQFTLLTVTWTGAAPDGKPSDAYHLQVQG
jgi:hypothetical protein